MKKPIFIIALVMAVFLTSCKTTVPANDSIIPTLTVMFSGDGINVKDLTINDPEFDTKAIYLKRDVEYLIVFSGKDTGGVKEVTWEYPIENITFKPDDPHPSNWTSGLDASNTSKIKSEGNRMDPKSSIIYSNNFTPRNSNGQDVSQILLKYTVTDFHNNELRKELRLIIGAGPTRIGNR